MRSVIQVDQMDEALRVALWNIVDLVYWQRLLQNMHPYRMKDLDTVLYQFWSSILKRPTDTKPSLQRDAWPYLREWFLKEAAWDEVYDFIELLPTWYVDRMGEGANDKFREYCNLVLQREMSGYRFVGGQLAPITSEEELNEVERAAAATTESAHAVHLSTAVRLLSDRKDPDYRNSIKESVTAVEAVAKKLSGSSKAGVADALGNLERSGSLPTTMKNAMVSLYGYASSPQSGARHPLGDTPSKVGFAEAKFALVTCSALINFMLERCGASDTGEDETA